MGEFIEVLFMAICLAVFLWFVSGILTNLIFGSFTKKGAIDNIMKMFKK